MPYIFDINNDNDLNLYRYGNYTLFLAVSQMSIVMHSLRLLISILSRLIMLETTTNDISHDRVYNCGSVLPRHVSRS